jgi:hypothetical protein
MPRSSFLIACYDISCSFHPYSGLIIDWINPVENETDCIIDWIDPIQIETGLIIDWIDPIEIELD